MKKQEDEVLIRDEDQQDEPGDILDSAAQTRFSEEIPLFSPIIRHDDDANVAVVPKRKISPLLLAALILVPVLLIGFMVFIFMSARGTRAPTQFQAPPEATVSGKIRSSLEEKLRLVEIDVENADPVEPQLAFPPMNFELDLEDASVRQQRQRRR